MDDDGETDALFQALAEGAVLGGYGGARLAKRVDPAVVRGVVIAVGCLLTAWFFWRS